MAEWRTKSIEAAERLGFPDHELRLLAHLLDDIDQLKRAVRGKNADEFMMAAASLNFHRGELYQRGVAVEISDAETLLSTVDASVHFWDILENRVEELQEGAVKIHIVEMPPAKFVKHMKDEVCQDVLKRLEETKQIYIVGLDVPISVTNGLFSLLDEKRREVARQKGIPGEQFDFEDLLGHFVGLTLSKGSSSGEERTRDILRRAGYRV